MRDMVADMMEDTSYEGQFAGFSEDSLELQAYLKEEKWGKGSWDEWASQTWAKQLKPQLTSLLSDCSRELSGSLNPELINPELARVNPNANIAKFFWGAVVREGRTRHSDIQFFVALRWGYVRVGLYLNSKDQKDPELFESLMSNLDGRDDDITRALEHAEANGVRLCQAFPPTFSGKVIPYSRTETTWRKEFEKRREIDLLKAWKIDDDILRTPDFAKEVLNAYSALAPFYRVLLGER